MIDIFFYTLLNLVKLAKARDKYPDLVAVFESDQFQPYVDFMAMNEYSGGFSITCLGVGNHYSG